MQRAITGFHSDEDGDWVAELACGHNQHVRHQPPFQLRPWVESAAGRTERLGAPLDCGLCERAELPEATEWVRTTATWDEHTMPAGLRRAHRVGAGTWGELEILAGQLRFRADTSPPIDHLLSTGDVQAIPPEVAHEVEPIGAVSFHVRFLRVDRQAHPHPPSPPSDENGNPGCEHSEVSGDVVG